VGSLYDIISNRITGDIPLEVESFVNTFLKSYKDNILAILFYGSCLRTGNFKNNVADFYIIVSEFPKKQKLDRYLSYFLPPNVYYLEIPCRHEILKAKYGIFTLQQFRKMSSINSFQPYLWARLVQPIQLVYTKNDDLKKEIISSILTASTTMLFNIIPTIKDHFNLKELWLHALNLTYKSEIRPERRNHISKIYNYSKDYLNGIAEKILNVLPYPIKQNNKNGKHYSIYISKRLKLINKIKWSVRVVNGKIISILRLIKVLFTFDNALSYGYFKLSKHTPGVKIPKIFKKSLLLSFIYIFLTGEKRKIFKNSNKLIHYY